jgi:hypothetical protein
VEAWQRVKLSLTNRSIGLISQYIFERHTQRQDRTYARSDEKNQRITIRHKVTYTYPRQPHLSFPRLADLVVIARGPHPIPSRTRP